MHDGELEELPCQFEAGSVKAKMTWFGAIALVGILSSLLLDRSRPYGTLHIHFVLNPHMKCHAPT
jgi:hypothetical protein